MQRELAESSQSHAARRRRKAPSARWSFAVRWLCCLLIVANLGGCCYVPGGRCRDWWCNGFKVGPNYCASCRPGRRATGSTTPIRASRARKTA